MFLQAPVEVPQYLGVSLLVEGAQIRHPLSSRTKTFIRSHYQSLHKSRHVRPPHKCPSGKENQYEEKKKIKSWLPISPRKVTMERSLTLQPLMEQRRPRAALPSSSGPLPNPAACHNLQISHTRIPTHTSCHRTHRHMLALNQLAPSLEIISLQPGINQNTHTYTHSSYTHRLCVPPVHTHTPVLLTAPAAKHRDTQKQSTLHIQRLDEPKREIKKQV